MTDFEDGVDAEMLTDTMDEVERLKQAVLDADDEDEAQVLLDALSAAEDRLDRMLRDGRDACEGFPEGK